MYLAINDPSRNGGNTGIFDRGSNGNNTRTSRILHVKVYIISSLVKCISYAVANVYEIVMSCGVYIIV